MMSEWISVEKELPEEDGEYLVLINGHERRVIPWHKDLERDLTADITHWFPHLIPPAPKDD